jgi:putative hemolysin
MKLSFAAAAVVAVIASGCAGNLTSPQTSAVAGSSGVASATAANASSLHQPAPQQLSPAVAARIQVPTDTSPDESQAAAYCKQTGGQVEVRSAVYGTNGPSTLQLAGVKKFCQYTANTSGGSRIHILLSTLYATKPTLAALAYIFAPPMGSCNGNPASCYCSLLGGSDQFGGTTGAGGGWYKKNSIDQVLEACVFPDMSSIDSWGLAYHSAGIIRGIDLTTVMRYKYTGDAAPYRR